MRKRGSEHSTSSRVSKRSIPSNFPFWWSWCSIYLFRVHRTLVPFLSSGWWWSRFPAITIINDDYETWTEIIMFALGYQEWLWSVESATKNFNCTNSITGDHFKKKRMREEVLSCRIRRTALFLKWITGESLYLKVKRPPKGYMSLSNQEKEFRKRRRGSTMHKDTYRQREDYSYFPLLTSGSPVLSILSSSLFKSRHFPTNLNTYSHIISVSTHYLYIHRKICANVSNGKKGNRVIFNEKRWMNRW